MAVEGADLHTHTNASDGMQPPARNVEIARDAGLEAVGITDHDTVAGVAEAFEAGKRLGIRVVPGVEISTVAAGQDIHVLGYFIDYEDVEFRRKLEELRRVRDTRNEMMVAKLRELGMDITMEEVVAGLGRELKPDETVGRPHIAQELMRKGYVATMAEAFDRFLGKNGAAYVNPPRARPDEAIRWIHEAGGAAVLAHPGLYGSGELVEALIGEGLDGIETNHSDHTEEDVARYGEMVRRHGLIATAGSDFHGERNGVVFHAPLGSRRTGADVVDKLEAAAKRYAERKRRT